MPAVFTPDLAAAQVHAHLESALHDLQEAEQSAVLWFADLNARKLFRELGFSSIHQYAEEALGFSQARTFQFLRLAERLESLSELRQAVADGSIPWTKARDVAGVATPDTEKAWVDAAKQSSRRELRKKIDAARARRKAARRKPSATSQGSMEDMLNAAAGSDPAAGGDAVAENGTAPAGDAVAGSERAPAGDPVTDAPSEPDDVVLEVMAEVTLRFTPEALARFEALMERVRTLGEQGKREDLVLAGLDALVAAAESHTQPDDTQRSTRVQSTHKVIVMACPDCGKGTVNTARGPLPLSLAELEAAACDATVEQNGKNHATVPPRLRRQALARDRHRCRAAGCRRTRFLHVHHIVLREDGGPNTLENMITLCSSCHGCYTS